MRPFTNIGWGGIWPALLTLLLGLVFVISAINDGVNEANVELVEVKDSIVEGFSGLDVTQRDLISWAEKDYTEQLSQGTDLSKIRATNAEIRDISATMQASLAVVETTILAIRTQIANVYTLLLRFETNLENQLIQLREINSKMPVAPLIERMNEAVNGIEFGTEEAVAFDALACEYDPIGIGPINCDFTAIAEGSLQATKFTFI